MIELIESLRKRMKRYRRQMDPSIGLEYNKININRQVSLDIYGIDIARTPHVVSKDVQAEARKVNGSRSYLDHCARKAKGRI